MAKLYTGQGDKGYTKTLNNKHISKCDVLIELIGTLDEFSAVLGIAKIYLEDKQLLSDIELLQRKLVGVMGELAGGNIDVTADCVAAAERMTDRYAADFAGFTPAGTAPASAFLDLARCVVRRAERLAAKAAQQGRVRSDMLAYLNRLGDLVYAMSRYAGK